MALIPDIEVENDPASILAGRDPQLERAIAEVKKALAGQSGHPAGQAGGPGQDEVGTTHATLSESTTMRRSGRRLPDLLSFRPCPAPTGYSTSGSSFGELLRIGP
jgi:hypothetical protein